MGKDRRDEAAGVVVKQGEDDGQGGKGQKSHHAEMHDGEQNGCAPKRHSGKSAHSSGSIENSAKQYFLGNRRNDDGRKTETDSLPQRNADLKDLDGRLSLWSPVKPRDEGANGLVESEHDWQGQSNHNDRSDDCTFEPASFPSEEAGPSDSILSQEEVRQRNDGAMKTDGIYHKPKEAFLVYRE